MGNRSSKQANKVEHLDIPDKWCHCHHIKKILLVLLIIIAIILFYMIYRKMEKPMITLPPLEIPDMGQPIVLFGDMQL